MHGQYVARGGTWDIYIYGHVYRPYAYYRYVYSYIYIRIFRHSILLKLQQLIASDDLRLINVAFEISYVYTLSPVSPRN